MPRHAGGTGRITLEDLCLHYRQGIRAVRNISLDIPPGQHLVVLGRSGSGKSSLLGCISGRLAPTHGSIQRDGRVAIIHQDLRLVKQRSALCNVLHGAMGRVGMARSMLTFPQAEKQQAVALLHRVGLGHRVHQRVSRLSGGEQQRVAIARALMQRPQILLADEPVASLDPENAREVMNLLTRITREEGLTMVTVLHDRELAHTYGDRIIGLASGELVLDVEPGERLPADPPMMALCQQCRGELEEGEGQPPATDRMATPSHQANLARLQFPSDADVPPTETAAKAQADARAELAEQNRHAMKQRTLMGLGGMVTAAVVVWSFLGLNIDTADLESAPESMSRFLRDLMPDSWAQVWALPWGNLSAALLETVQMAIIGTLLGVVISWPLSALAATNVGPRWVRMPMRLVLNAVRTVPSIIWGLFFVAAVGLGPFAGVMALAAYSVGYLTKFYYEGFEGVDPGPPDALREIGANGPQRFMHAVWPAAQPAVVSSSLFMVEYNVRAASVLGIVGAGGIGWEMKMYYDYRSFPAMLAALVLILVVVVVLDSISNIIRARLVQV